MVSIRATNLSKIYSTGFRKTFSALKEVSFTIPAGEVTGYLGPNGAGKTTTFKILTGLIKASSGEAFIDDISCDDPASRRLLGYLPEAPYFYEHLSAEESLYFYASLFKLKPIDIKKCAYDLMERFGILFAKDRKLRTYSKGMRQRLGFAQCLINNPQVVILDEPMSGLDPMGRKDFRDMILELKSQGKTVLMSSHVLSDIETICDRMILLSKGELKEEGKISDLLAKTLQETEITFLPYDASYESCLPEGQYKVLSTDKNVTIRVGAEANMNDLLSALIAHQHRIIKVMPHNSTLEDYFIRLAKGS